MLFDKILDTLRDNGKAAMAYEMTVELTNEAMERDPERAAGYRLLCAYAERYLQFTQRMPVTVRESEAAFAGFTEALEALRAGYVSQDADAINKALNQVAIWSRQYLEQPLPSVV
jgi:hypothetical protein